MNYSKIDKIRIKNYNAINDITLEFDEDTPIISLVADNGVGKTSIINALSAVALNDQNLKTHIRHGKSELEVDVMLNDKTLIQRKKGTKNIARVMLGDGTKVLDIDKIDKGYKIKEIDDRMGWWQEEETKQALQKRSYLDPLLFVQTKAGENYKIFYNALKVNELLNGIKVGNDDINGQKKLINEDLAKKKAYLEMKEQTKIVDTSELEIIQKQLQRDEEISQLLEYIKERIKIQKIDKVEIPEIKYFTEIERCKELIKSVNDYKEKHIEIPRVSKVANYLKMLIDLKTISQASTIPKVYELDNIKELYDKGKALEKEIKEVSAKVKGMEFKCPHCGEVIIGGEEHEHNKEKQ